MKLRSLSPLILAVTAVLASACVDTIGEQLRRGEDESDYITFEAQSDWKDVGEGADSRSGVADDTDTKLLDVIPVCIDGGADSLFLYVYEEDMPFGDEVQISPESFPIMADSPTDEAIQVVELSALTDSAVQGFDAVSTGSRGTTVSSASTIENYSLTGYKYSSDKDWGPDCYPNFMYNETRKNTWDVWANGTVYQWPGSEYNMRFFAHYPTNLNTLGELSSPEQGGGLTLDYTMPREVKDQIDILTADTGVLPGDYRKTVPLKFRHALSSIEFYADNTLISGTYLYFKIDSVFVRGLYDFENNTWSQLSAKSSIEENRVYGKMGYGVVSENDRNIFIIPQTIPSDATISFAFRDSISKENSWSRKATVPISGTWQTGKKYRYVLSSTSVIYTPVVTNSTDYPSANGGTATINLLSKCNYSIKESSSTTMGSTACDLQFLELVMLNPATGQYDLHYDYKNLPSDLWIHNINVTGSNGSYNVTYTVDPNTEYDSNISIKASSLRSESIRGSALVPWNLANPGGEAPVKNTANCYVVNSPGTYSIPLVYGNAIVNGIYNSKLNRGNLANCRYNHLHTDSVCPYRVIHPYPYGGCVTADGSYDVIRVNKPYIYDFAPAGMSAYDYIDDVKLIWQDQRSLITNLRLGTDHKTLIFDVPKETIQQGNALISVMSRGKVLWSWHIWVTDVRVTTANTTTVQDANSRTRNIFDVNLGWVDESYGIMERTARLMIRQVNTGRNYYVPLKQNGDNIVEDGFSPLWQWGCPIPRMLEGRDYYDIDGNIVPRLVEDFSTGYNTTDFFANVYSNPGIICIGSKYCFEMMNAWTWNTNSCENYDWFTKSIYDPCPDGTAVPVCNAFTGFTISGANVEATDYSSVDELISLLNTSDTVFGPKGSFKTAHFYSYLNRKNYVMPFPLTGNTTSSTGSQVNNRGVYWTVTPCNFQTGAYALAITPYSDNGSGAFVKTKGAYARSICGSIRPMYGNYE